MFRKTILLLLIASGTYTVQAQKTPSFEEIVSYLKDKISARGDGMTYTIARKPDGYYLVSNYYEDGTLLRLEYDQIWSSKSKEYTPLSIPSEYRRKTDRDHLIPLGDHLRRMNWESHWNQRRRFESVIYVGYPEWSVDVKKDFANKSNLTPQEHEWLGRAYAEEAAAFIHPDDFGHRFEFSKSFEQPGYEKISPERINAFADTVEKSMKHWLAIRKTDPDYKPGVIKDLNLKIAHEYMHFYSKLMSVKEEEKAKVYLNKVQYGEAYLQYAKNLLDACDQNGILLTDGDSDTFPLWYMQDAKGYRQDVIVLNLSLFQTAWYKQMIREKYNLKTSFSNEDYKRFRSIPFFAHPELEEEQFSQWMSALDTLDNQDKYALMPAKLRVNYLLKMVRTDLERSTDQSVAVFLLDMLENNPDRTLYGSSQYSLSQVGLEDYAVSRGPVFKLGTKYLEGTLVDSETVKAVETWIDRLDPELVNQLGPMKKHRISFVYQSIGALLQFQPSEGKRLLAKFQRKFPLEKNLDDSYPFVTLGRAYFPDEMEKYRAMIKIHAPEAIRYIQTIRANDEDLYEKVSELYYMHYVYDIERPGAYASFPERKHELPEAAKTVLRVMWSKVEELLKSDEVSKRTWTKRKLQSMEYYLRNI